MPLRISKQDLNKLKYKRPPRQKPQKPVGDENVPVPQWESDIDTFKGLRGVHSICSHHLSDPQACWRCKQKVRELASLYLHGEYTHALCLECSRQVACSPQGKS